ncbi:MAG: hypothetical protein DHS80DRAFT_21561 [Piptocephalis tieghemiana]|nr:MAG: hypothetical protein DHS80DRAFT_21561 [Piptocephalis tieghemiana]
MAYHPSPLNRSTLLGPHDSMSLLLKPHCPTQALCGGVQGQWPLLPPLPPPSPASPALSFRSDSDSSSLFSSSPSPSPAQSPLLPPLSPHPSECPSSPSSCMSSSFSSPTLTSPIHPPTPPPSSSSFPSSPSSPSIAPSSPFSPFTPVITIPKEKYNYSKSCPTRQSPSSSSSSPSSSGSPGALLHPLNDQSSFSLSSPSSLNNIDVIGCERKQRVVMVSSPSPASSAIPPPPQENDPLEAGRAWFHAVVRARVENGFSKYAPAHDNALFGPDAFSKAEFNLLSRP